MKNAEDEIVELIKLPKVGTLEFALDTAVPITVNDRILTQEDKQKLIAIAKIIF